MVHTLALQSILHSRLQTSLHVMENERFAEFASTLQKEIKDETGVKFSVLQLDMFAGITYEKKVTHEHIITSENLVFPI